MEACIAGIQKTEGAQVSVGRTSPTERREEKSNGGWEITLVIGRGPVRRHRRRDARSPWRP